MASIYLIGSLRNPAVPDIGNRLRAAGHDVFDDWVAGGEHADDAWQAYETKRGRTYAEALKGKAARNTFRFDETNLLRCEVAVLVAPAGKSAHIELGVMLGKGKPGYVLFDAEPERWDVMYQFATGVFFNTADLIAELAGEKA
jgi:hypothetical protein